MKIEQTKCDNCGALHETPLSLEYRGTGLLTVLLRVPVKMLDARGNLVQTVEKKQHDLCGEVCLLELLTKRKEEAQQPAKAILESFWQSVLSGITREVIPKNLFRIGPFVYDEMGRLQSFDADKHIGVIPTPVLLIADRPVYDLFLEDARHAGGLLASVSRADIARELSGECYRISNPRDVTRVHRMLVGGQRYTCWAIDLLKFPFAKDFEDALAEPKPEA